MNGRTAGHLILMTTICVVIFWTFMALRPASAPLVPVTWHPSPSHAIAE